MRIIKIYLIVASIMLLGALGMGVYVWYAYQKSLEPATHGEAPVATSETS